MDPVNAELFKDSIRDAIKENKLVIFSSHQMGYVEEFCDDITLIDKGEILINGSLADVKAEMSQDKYRLDAANLNREQLKQLLKQIEFDFYPEHDLLANEDKISLIIDLSNIAPNNFLQKSLQQMFR